MNAVARLAAPEPMRVMTTDTGCDPRSRSRAPQRVGVDVDAAHQDLDGADSRAPTAPGAAAVRCSPARSSTSNPRTPSGSRSPDR